MIKNSDIHATIDQVLLGLKEKGMAESSIRTGYQGVYNTFLKFLDENKISEMSEDICIQYIESKNQIRLPSLLTVTSDASLNRRIRALVLLLRYRETGSLDLRTRGKKAPFSCPAALTSAYETFEAETEKSHLAAATKSTIIDSTRRFIMSVSEDGLSDWGLLEMIIQKIYSPCAFRGTGMSHTHGHQMSLRDFLGLWTANRLAGKGTMPFFHSVSRPGSGPRISGSSRSTTLTGKRMH